MILSYSPSCQALTNSFIYLTSSRQSVLRQLLQTKESFFSAYSKPAITCLSTQSLTLLNFISESKPLNSTLSNSQHSSNFSLSVENENFSSVEVRRHIITLDLKLSFICKKFTINSRLQSWHSRGVPEPFMGRKWAEQYFQCSIS